jgi:hypothetical protein
VVKVLEDKSYRKPGEKICFALPSISTRRLVYFELTLKKIGQSQREKLLSENVVNRWKKIPFCYKAFRIF